MKKAIISLVIVSIFFCSSNALALVRQGSVMEATLIEVEERLAPLEDEIKWLKVENQELRTEIKYLKQDVSVFRKEFYALQNIVIAFQRQIIEIQKIVISFARSFLKGWQ